ncbi:MAG: hypothetical protein H6713_40630 [Myxococcales bacterium]|nr:hypothetical protein [Myxococcales bacterium]
MAAPLDPLKIEAKIESLQAKLFRLHAKRDAGTRAVQYRIACVTLHVIDLQLILCEDPIERASLHRSRAAVSADVTRLLKQESKDRYLQILDAFDRIESATTRLRPLSERQR